MLHLGLALLASTPLDALDSFFSPLYKAAELKEVATGAKDLFALLSAHGLLRLAHKRYRGKH